MHVTVALEELKRGISWIGKAAAAAPVHISAEGKRLRLQIHSGDTWRRIDLTAEETPQAGSLFIPHLWLARLAQAGKADLVQCKLAQSELVITCGRSRVVLPVVKPDRDEFAQTCPFDTYTKLASIDATDFTSAFLATAKQVSDATEPGASMMRNVQLRTDADQNSLRLCGSNKYRIAELHATATDVHTTETYLVDPSLVADGLKLLSGQCHIIQSGAMIGLCDDTKMSLIPTSDDAYPTKSIDAIVTTINGTIDAGQYLSFDRGEMLDAIKWVSGDQNLVRLAFQEDMIDITTHGQSMTTASARGETSIDASDSQADEVAFAVNATYFSTLLNILTTPAVRLHFSSPVKPLALSEVANDRPDNNGGSNTKTTQAPAKLVALMPVRL